MERRGITSFFYTHGFLCASHPVELLLLCITGTVCLLTLNIYDATHSSDGSFSPAITAKVSLPTSFHVHFSATIYFLALLCLYLQCKKLLHTGSTYLVVIVGIFLVFSGVVYTSIVGNIFGGELSALREAVPFFCLLSDFVTVGALAKFALLSKSYEEAPSKIAHGVATLSPSVTLNTLVGALVIGVGSLSGVEELETASYFGCLALLTHYFMFMTFLPACLSLFLELCTRGQSQPLWLLESSSELSTEEHEQRPNPLLQVVKGIMSAGLMCVHVHSRFMVRTEHGDGSGQNKRDSASSSDLSRFLAVNAEEIVAFVLALLVAAKYLYLEKDEASTLLEAQDLKEKPTETSTPSTNTGIDLKEKLLNVQQDNRRKRSATFSLGDERDIEEYMDIIPAINERVGEHLTKSSVQLLPPSKSLEFDSKGLKSSPKRRSFSFNHIHVPKCFKIPEKEKSIAVSSSRSDLSKASSPVITVSRHLFPSDNNHTSKEFDHDVEVKSCRDGVRSIGECKRVMRQPDGIFSLTDEEICTLVEEKIIPFYQLESALKNFQRAVHIRRNITTRKIHRSQDVLSDLPYEHYDYSLVSGACCENVIGYMPIPVGVAGPLFLDGHQYYVPMATTEGCLVASTNRGCRALSGSGVRSSILADGMTRGPVVRFPSAMQASEVKHWLEDEYNFEVMKKAFDSTSRFARLKSIKCAIAGRLLFARFSATTGDAMGMNMVSKGTEQALQELHEEFPCMEVLSLSGNYCSDKKATAMNWIEGRGKSVVCEAIVPGHIVSKVLKTTVTALTELNTSKNLVGSAMAGAIGGFNAHAANIVTALFIATGQDPAQNMGSSNCITLLEHCGPNREDLYISCTMPSLEVGTIGGGTLLAAQASCLEMLGVRGACNAEPGQNATKLARITCATVLAGELSLLSALATGQLVQSHLKHNRSTINLCGEEAAKNCAVL